MSQRISAFIRPVIAALLAVGTTVVIFGVTPARASRISVTNIDDDGAGSLRQAIVDANANPGADVITFAAGVTGTITLASNLPFVTEDLTIQGPGQSSLTIDGVNSYRIFTIMSTGASLTFSNMTLKKGNSGVEGSGVFNVRATVNATDVTFKDFQNSAVFNKEGGTVATYTRVTFRNNTYGVTADHGSTPSSVSDTDSDYPNRTYIIDSLFDSNSMGISSERFTKISNSRFVNNNYAAYLGGLNRSQVRNSTFDSNQFALGFGCGTNTSWTSVGRNNRFVDGNTFTNNDYAFYLADSWNNGHASQQWTTITNNTWDGSGTWVYAYKWDEDSQQNTEFSVNTVNTSTNEWYESGNVNSATTTTTTSTTSTTTVPSSSTTTPGTTTTTASSTTIPSGGGSGNAVTTSGRTRGSNVTTTIVDQVTSTTAPVMSTTTTVPAPKTPALSPGESAATVDGQPVESSVSRIDNSLVLSGAGIKVTVSGESTDGSRIGLDADGNLRLQSDDRIAVEATGYDQSAQVDIWLNSTPVLLGSLKADMSGNISGTYSLPAGFEAGNHKLVLEGPNVTGQNVVLGIGLSVGKSSSGSMVARVLIAIPVSLAVLLGLVIPTRLRRRRETGQLA